MVRNIQVNPDAFGNGEFAAIPVGTKVAVSVFDIKEGVSGPNSKNPGAPQFEFTAKVTGDFEWDDVEKGHQSAKGREIRYNYIPLDPNAGNSWALVAFAEAVGWPTDKEAGVSVPDDLRDVLGVEFTAKIGQSTGQNGSIYNRVVGYQKLGKGGSTPTAETKDWTKL